MNTSMLLACNKPLSREKVERAHQRVRLHQELTTLVRNNNSLGIDAFRCYRSNCLLFPPEPVNNSRGRNHVNLLLLLPMTFASEECKKREKRKMEQYSSVWGRRRQYEEGLRWDFMIIQWNGFLLRCLLLRSLFLVALRTRMTNVDISFIIH